ncbi:MAG TPA: glycosyltransferase [Thermoanaerobaculia bacterium]|nr:glycosyltransferase [Thermoanaerobaculia bacterium]
MIPNVIHFCYGFVPDLNGKPFSLVHYLAVRSAAETNHPEAIRFYYKHEPRGEWWERARPYLELVPIEPPHEIHGVPVRHHAHQTDYVRLQILRHQGGIYLDMDVLCLRSFRELRSREFVLGQEGVEGRHGLCNAVILAAPGAWFTEKWLEGFDPARSHWNGFRSTGWDRHWNEMAVRYPAFLARTYPARVHVLDHRAFFWPTWEDSHLRMLYLDSGLSFADSYCVHLWEQVAWERYLADLTIDSIRRVDTNFNLLARRFLAGL